MKNQVIKKSVIAEVAFVRIMVVVLQLVFLKYYTHYTDFYELGIFYFLLTISYSLNAFLLVPLDYFQQSQLYNLKEKGLSLKSFFKINVWVLKMVLSGLLLSLIVSYFLKPDYCLIITLVIIYAISSYLVTLIRGFINNLEMRRTAIYCLALEYLLKIVYYFIYIHFFKSSAVVILLSLLSASLTAFVVLFYLVSRLKEYKLTTVKKFESKDVLAICYPISISAFLNWIQLQSYTLLLVPLGLTEVVGIYATVANVGSGGMNAYSTIFSQLFIPNLYKTTGSFIKKYLLYGLISILIVLIVSFFFSKMIVGLLTKQDFIKYSLIIMYGILTEGGNLLIAALTVYLSIHNLTKYSIKVASAGIAAFFVSFFVLYLTHSIGVFTIGLPMIISQFLICTGLTLVVYKDQNEVIWQVTK